MYNQNIKKYASNGNITGECSRLYSNCLLQLSTSGTSYQLWCQSRLKNVF